MPDTTQTAGLYDNRGNLIGQTEVTPFPHNPDIIEWNGRYFHNGDVGYGTNIAYTEGTFYAAPSEKPAVSDDNPQEGT